VHTEGQQIMQSRNRPTVRRDPAGTHPPADGSRTTVTAPADPAVPRLAPGVELLGEYLGSGLTEPTYLARRPPGQVMQISRLLYLVLSEIDGSRTAEEIGDRASAAFGRRVSAGNVEYLLASKLAPLGLLAGSDMNRAVKAKSAILTLKARRTLVPDPAVQVVARLLRPLFNPFVVVAVLVGFSTADFFLYSHGQFHAAAVAVLNRPVVILLILGLVVLSMLFHECGHAAACRYGGARPGVIGMGLYVVWPAFYTNVTDSYQLSRAGRLRTDLGGIYFNAIFAVASSVVYLATDYAPLLVVILLVHLEIFQQLLPTFRLDGYFILADVAGVPDLFDRMAPVLLSMIPGRPADPRVENLKRVPRMIVTVWVLCTVPVLGLYLVFVILHGPDIASTFAGSATAQGRDIVAALREGKILVGLLGVLSLLLLALPILGLSYVLLLTGRRVVRLAAAAGSWFGGRRE
jgi:putative peptide zinc metalloprotease protein